ncbi:hypothetical protein PFICI_09765 [Pestalotiopsis fici W106-1]|uniref:SprT-like domain-containing protein n=1 Tax=Pestalotiopsis fici (strain W106-1 / CGMCC3.15140) TaxID=1229662 RepID=W3WV09_PESFW|nr:uncharacterized protein PFICI_09765 [Pestalotiopsis fici W106-1]ETS77703.1 hypothetical protein PFICI_09765 [Pestalotiopsis fici W106-1]
MDSYLNTPMGPRKPLSRDPNELLQQTTTMLFTKSEVPGSLRERLIGDFVGLFKQRDELDADVLLRKMFIILDYYYFQRSLSEHAVQLSIYNQGPTASDLAGLYIGGGIYMYRHSGSNGERITPSEMISTLIHEMTHAYFAVLTDRAKRRELVDKNGGHGLPWNALYHSIINDVCKWSPELATFGQLLDERGTPENINDANRLSYQLDQDEHTSDNKGKGK